LCPRIISEDDPVLVKNAKEGSGRGNQLLKHSKKIMKEKQKSDNSPSKDEKIEESRPARIEIDHSIVKGKGLLYSTCRQHFY
jgi:hypothetical protein